MKEFLTENLSLKLFSLILAILVELYFYSPDNSVTETLVAGIDVRNLPPSMMLVWPPTNDNGLSAKVSVQGPGPLVEQAKAISHKLLIHLPAQVPMTFAATLNPKQLSLPSGVRVNSIEPAQVELKFERAVKKELLVVVAKIGEPAQGYKIEEMKVFPETVIATGPKSELEGLQIIETEKIDISNLTATERLEVPLVERGPLTTLRITVVTVEIKVTPISEDKTFDKVDVQVTAPEGSAASFEPGRVKVTVSGPSSLIRGLEKGQIQLIVEARNLKEGRYELPLVVHLPPEITLVKTEPATVVVYLVPKKK